MTFIFPPSLITTTELRVPKSSPMSCDHGLRFQLFICPKLNNNKKLYIKKRLFIKNPSCFNEFTITFYVNLTRLKVPHSIILSMLVRLIQSFSKYFSYTRFIFYSLFTHGSLHLITCMTVFQKNGTVY